MVQEALTNALKHAHGSSTAVDVRYDDREITLEISTAGTGPEPALVGAGPRSPGGSGRGLVGLRERANALGGEFDADREADGRFVVRARIPTGSRA
ncbi:ATP-binding protein [Kribbella capetownensis]|uniref:ATP-binding protein n=1 Tax=Kribbella capetownensis TaxID=1572659 RepID=UPI00192DD375|nr:ATP-binding protein [Kribbella capetownensis]